MTIACIMVVFPASQTVAQSDPAVEGSVITSPGPPVSRFYPPGEMVPPAPSSRLSTSSSGGTVVRGTPVPNPPRLSSTGPREAVPMSAVARTSESRDFAETPQPIPRPEPRRSEPAIAAPAIQQEATTSAETAPSSSTAAAAEVATLPPTLPPAEQVAEGIPNVDTPAAGDIVLLVFAADETEVSPALRGQLDTVIANLESGETLRTQLWSYAGDSSGPSSSEARRASLARALSVRSYMIDKGISTKRIDVRALGNKTSEGPPNRVEVRVVTR